MRRADNAAAPARRSTRLKVLIVSSEVVPFAKTGGLADVAGALPAALAALGHEVRVAMPKYASVDEERHKLLPILGDIQVRLGRVIHEGFVKKTVFADTRIPVYLIVNDALFGREGLYGEKGVDYPDNAVRFAFFCKAVIWLLKGLDWTPDVIQCNDWQSALVPVYLRTEPDMLADPYLSASKVLYTIHNLAYQGLFPAEDCATIGIGPELFHPAGLEFYGKLNLMKGGILFSDAVSTVSRRYAEEIQTAEYGCGLDGVLRAARGRLHGIMNGIDTAAWNPATDPNTAATFSAKEPAGKAVCKAALQKAAGLPSSPDTPLIGIISRLDSQKGFDLIAEILPDLMKERLQMVVLGTGAPEYHQLFTDAAARYPGKISVHLRFDNALAHQIEAGSDMFLMPSRYEPCGLNQLYSLRYGTLPIVRETGGLADSVTDANERAIASGEATGFVFDRYESAELLKATRRALAMYRDQGTWARVVRNAMARDNSWASSAREYDRLFRAMTAA
jgi:starch synthase